MSAIKTRIMYIQQGWSPGRIGRVQFSKSGRTLYYGGQAFESLAGRGFKTNYVDLESGREYWISGPRRDGQDTQYPGRVEIDPDVVDEYWRDVRGLLGVRDTHFFSRGVHGNHATR